jgi:hypothetical protein
MCARPPTGMSPGFSEVGGGCGNPAEGRIAVFDGPGEGNAQPSRNAPAKPCSLASDSIDGGVGRLPSQVHRKRQRRMQPGPGRSHVHIFVGIGAGASAQFPAHDPGDNFVPGTHHKTRRQPRHQRRKTARPD